MQVHLKLHIVTPAVYSTPESTVASRLLVRVLDDVLLPVAYPAELAGSSYSLSTGQGGLLLKVEGFTGVAQQLMLEVLTALKSEMRGQGKGSKSFPVDAEAGGLHGGEWEVGAEQ
jgi:secreted Zn-dependent insulinase-like peptidase